EQCKSGRLPCRRATFHDRDVGIAEIFGTLCCALGDTISVIHQHHAHAPAWQQALDVHFETAVGEWDGKERVPVGVLPGLAYVEEGDLLAVGEHRLHGPGGDRLHHRAPHVMT